MAMDKRLFFKALTSVFIVFSCGVSEVGRADYEKSDGNVWGGPIAGPDTEHLMSVCYVTALDYEEGYDWRSDPEKESVRCSLVVLADGVPFMKVPVSNMYSISSDVDMHRIIDGQLYTDFATDSTTVIKRNGTFLYSYSGAERICGMVVRDSDVYTLGENRSGTGFSFRKNGEALVTRDRASLVSSLRLDGDKLSFAFIEQIRSADGYIPRYFSVCDGVVSQVFIRDDVIRVMDILIDDSTVVYLASIVGISQPVIIAGEDMMALDIPRGMTMVSGTLFKIGSDLAVEGLCSAATGARMSGIWKNGVKIVTFTNQSISALCAEGDGVFCVVNPLDDKSSGKIYCAGETYEMPKGYVCMGTGAMSVVNGILNVGLSSLNGGRPVLWKDGQSDTLNVNGYIANVKAD